MVHWSSVFHCKEHGPSPYDLSQTPLYQSPYGYSFFFSTCFILGMRKDRVRSSSIEIGIPWYQDQHIRRWIIHQTSKPLQGNFDILHLFFLWSLGGNLCVMANWRKKIIIIKWLVWMFRRNRVVSFCSTRNFVKNLLLWIKEI